MTVTGIVAGATVEIGFGVNAVGGDYLVLGDPVKGKLDDATYLLAPDTVFVVVSQHVAMIDTDRGRERELDEYKTGTAVVVFNDDDRTFDPAYSGSSYAGQITPMRRIRVAWENIEVFNGWVDDWFVTYEPGDNLSRVTASCVDGFAILANQELSTVASSFSGDLAGTRITRVLDRSEVAFPASREIDAGNTTFGATTLGGNVLAYLQACAKAEAGYLFVSTGGTLTFRNRLAVLNVQSDAIFSDDPDDGIPYMAITQRSSTDLLFTRVTGSSESTGTEMSAVASTATTDDFLVRTLPLGTLFTIDNSETQELVDYYLSRYSSIELRFHTVAINLASLTTAQVQTVLSLELTDVVTVERSPLSVGSTISRLSLLDSVRHHITPGSWTIDLTFANADTRSFLMLDDAVFGVLNANRLAF